MINNWEETFTSGRIDNSIFGEPKNSSITDIREKALAQRSIMECSVTKYNTKNYLRENYIDNEWIDTLNERNEKKMKNLQKLTTEQ